MGRATNRLLQGAAQLGLTLDDTALTKLHRYLELLQTWNARINLTSIHEPLDIIDRHFLDCMTIVPLLDRTGTLVDIGSGAGFPGAVVAIACPGIKVTCVEATHKKVAFLQTLRRELNLSIEPLPLRDNQLADRTFDAAVSRATWDPAVWLEHGAPLVNANGLLIAMQTDAQPTLSTPSNFEALAPLRFDIAGAARRIQAFRRI